LATKTHVPYRRRRALALGSVLVAALGAAVAPGCSRDIDYGYGRSGWDKAAVQQATDMANRFKAGPRGCGEIMEEPFAALKESYQRTSLPLPLGVVSCDTPDEENVTFEVFESPEVIAKFKEAKKALLCEKGAKLPGFPGVPYVDGGSWLIEPDRTDTAKELAGMFGGTQGSVCPATSPTIVRTLPPGQTAPSLPALPTTAAPR
jgi:hypothetical protein